MLPDRQRTVTVRRLDMVQSAEFRRKTAPRVARKANECPSTGGGEEKKLMFGPHLMLDLYGCNKERLVDVKFVHQVLDELPELLGMHKIMPPYVIPYDGSGKEDGFDKGGISGIVIIAESHISVHTFVAQEYASFDIFSCKEFDVDRCVKMLVDAFGAKKVEKNFLMRGREFPKDIKKAAEIIKRQRKLF